jgi:curved DNA-binding protein CbpA
MGENYEQLTYYELLGVPEDASAEDIQAARRKLVRELHPDNKSKAYRARFDQMMAEANEAYDVLRDPKKRAAYNLKLHQHREQARRQHEQTEREAQAKKEREDERERQRDEQQRKTREERQRRQREQAEAHEQPHQQEKVRKPRGRALMLWLLVIGIVGMGGYFATIIPAGTPDGTLPSDASREEASPIDSAQDDKPTGKISEEQGASEPTPPEQEAATQPGGQHEPSCGGSPENILAQQYRYINEGNYGAAYALFATQSKALITPGQYRVFFEEYAPYSVMSYSFSKVDVRSDAATIGVAFTISSAGERLHLKRTQQLLCEGGSWRVVMRDEQVAAFTEAGQ